MPATERAQDLVRQLDTALQSVIGLQRANDLDAFKVADGRTKYLVDTPVRVASHFDIRPAVLIFDPLLGTLGLVDTVLVERDEDLAGLDKVVRDHIDAATYARHLLLRNRKARRTAATVELVLLTSDETELDRKALDSIGNTLRDVLRQTETMFHVGVGILAHGGKTAAFGGRLHRAFPWLLVATRKWFSSPHALPMKLDEPAATADPQSPNPAGADRASAAAPPSANGRSRLTHLALTNYRLPGRRVLDLAETRIHFIHGPNGSGKSSLVEALELVSNGKVERLERAGEKDYRRVIQNRDHDETARIELGWAQRPAPDAGREVTDTGISNPIAAQVHCGSFRLDQPLMDRLIGLFPHERASNFLSAFFPEAAEPLRQYQEAVNGRAQALTAGAQLIETIELARKALVEFGKWRGGEAIRTTEEFPALLNTWLEKTALLDLSQRGRSVRSAFVGARTAGWQPQDTMTATIAAAAESAAIDPASVERQEGAWKAEVDDLQKKLSSFRAQPASRGAAGPSVTPVTLAQVQALNAVSRCLFDEETHQSHGPFGDKVAGVILRGDAPTYGPIVIGSEEWAAPMLKDLDAMKSAWADLESEKPAGSWPAKIASEEFLVAAEQQTAVLAAGRELNDRFVERLDWKAEEKGEYDGSLIAAVNELMALFTPARWGYQDIRLPSRLDAGKLGLSIELGEGAKTVRAELHLNTAELNLFTVALFLLCASRVPKPLGLLILDDPLQNMDELTSTALARGLAKLVRLCASLDRHEEIMVLFHGYDDVDRFKKELPAAVYRLPWLSPGTAPTEIKIEVQWDMSDVLGVQEVAALLDKT